MQCNVTANRVNPVMKLIVPRTDSFQGFDEVSYNTMPLIKIHSSLTNCIIISGFQCTVYWFSLFEAIRKLSEIIRSIYEVTIFVSTYPLSYSHPTADGVAV